MDLDVMAGRNHLDLRGSGLMALQGFEPHPLAYCSRPSTPGKPDENHHQNHLGRTPWWWLLALGTPWSPFVVLVRPSRQLHIYNPC
jgi:hypothetical protein